jgi:peptide deformylase
MLTLVTHEKKELRQPSQPVDVFDADLATLACDMNEIMIAAHGIGLAAPQIGKNIRLIVVKEGETGSAYRAYANPVITFYSRTMTASEEGCLSVPGVYGFVSRSTKVRFTYQDLDGTKHRAKAQGMDAIVLQHEVDHINGTLIIDRDFHVTQGADQLRASTHT